MFMNNRLVISHCHVKQYSTDHSLQYHHYTEFYDKCLIRSHIFLMFANIIIFLMSNYFFIFLVTMPQPCDNHVYHNRKIRRKWGFYKQ